MPGEWWLNSNFKVYIIKHNGMIDWSAKPCHVLWEENPKVRACFTVRLPQFYSIPSKATIVDHQHRDLLVILGLELWSGQLVFAFEQKDPKKVWAFWESKRGGDYDIRFKLAGVSTIAIMQTSCNHACQHQVEHSLAEMDMHRIMAFECPCFLDSFVMILPCLWTGWYGCRKTPWGHELQSSHWWKKSCTLRCMKTSMRRIKHFK